MSEPPESDFTMRDIWESAVEWKLEDADVVIRSHGESYGVGTLGNDGDGRMTIGGLCSGYSGINPAAISVPGDAVATRLQRHKLAEELAVHLEDIASGLRRDFPA